MLRFQSLFWATKDPEKLSKKLSSLGLRVGKSLCDPETQSVYFGPESIELFGVGQKLQSLTDLEGLSEFSKKGDGIFAMALESDHIAHDYARLKNLYPLEKPRRAEELDKEIPLWYGFNIPDHSLGLRTWVMMNSPQTLEKQAADHLPFKHGNSCFGIEAVHTLAQDLEAVTKKWSQIIEKPDGGLKWNELGRTSGRRLQSGERFLDILTHHTGNLMNHGAQGRDGVFMITLKVADLELAKNMAKGAGAEPIPCMNRDGFIISPEFTGGPSLRFVRAFWKQYLPTVNDFFPNHRRPDGFRPLGGAYSTTLFDGFEDNWKY